MWDSATGKELAGWAQKSLDGWCVVLRFVRRGKDNGADPLAGGVNRALQYTDDESKAVRLVTNEVQVYDPSNFDAGVVDKLRLEGVTTCGVSPGRNPSVALFVSEKKVRRFIPSIGNSSEC